MDRLGSFEFLAFDAETWPVSYLFRFVSMPQLRFYLLQNIFIVIFKFNTITGLFFLLIILRIPVRKLLFSEC